MPDKKTSRFIAQMGDFVVVKPGKPDAESSSRGQPDASDGGKNDTQKKPEAGDKASKTTN